MSVKSVKPGIPRVYFYSLIISYFEGLLIYVKGWGYQERGDKSEKEEVKGVSHYALHPYNQA